jgi:hypothetical protein
MSDAAAAAPDRRIFVVEAADGIDGLLRVLGPFALAGAEPVSVNLERRRGRLDIRIEAEGLDDRRAETLHLRLEGLACVTSVGVLRLFATRQVA